MKAYLIKPIKLIKTSPSSALNQANKDSTDRMNIYAFVTVEDKYLATHEICECLKLSYIFNSFITHKSPFGAKREANEPLSSKNIYTF